jgi:hypothetical protein
VLELRARTPNAFALPSGDIVVTTGLVSVLTHDQIRTVLRHEHAHAAESAASWVGRIVPVAALIAFGPLSTMLLRGAGDIGALLVLVVVFSGLLVAVKRLEARGRALEADADHHAAQDDPHLYAGSLETLYRVTGLPATNRRGSHPPLYDRLLSAGVQPDYPRPDPPGRRPVLAGLGLALAVTVAIPVTPVALMVAADEPLRTEISIAVGYDGETGPATLATRAIVDGDGAQADEILATAADAGYDRARLDIAVAAELTVAGFCDEARRRFDDVDDEIENHLEAWAITAENLHWSCG